MRNHLTLMLAGLALFVGSCQTNPLGSATMPSAAVGAAIDGVREEAVPSVFFSPSTNSSMTTSNIAAAGVAMVSLGGLSRVHYGPSTPGTPEGSYGLPAGWPPPPPPVMGSALCGGNCLNFPNYRGIGGLNGDYNSDYFLRWKGFKGPDPSRDYSSMTWYFGGGTTGTPTDLSQYRGIVFWARGSGNFAINLAARNGVDGVPVVAPAVKPYEGWNFYLRRFGAELNGNQEWKQIIVYFSEMVQEYGLAADKQLVLENAVGLQFDQQAPYQDYFQLDLDYIAFF